MEDIVYSASPELRRPRHFAAKAMLDLRASGAIAWRLFRSNLRIRHRRTFLGYLWLLLPVMGTVLICSYIHSRRIVSIAPTSLPYPLFVLSGMILWQSFVDAINAPLQQLTAARQLITRSRVPHEAIILAGAMEVLLNAAVRLAVLVVVIAIWVPFVPSMVLIPAGVVALVVFGLAIGLAVAPLGLLYDDIGRVIAMAMTFWFFLTPVIYPLPSFGPLRFNPVAPLLVTTRSWLLGWWGVSNGFLVIVGIALVGLVAAWLWYRLARPHVVSRLG
ncbi:MAG: ABC transporter permease [Pseudomonadota bacterium]|jgi:lipopolysaccharide transport system permease protein|uniref:O-antigen export system, permease protein n=1 Tax=hydrothermal vent metagenome TaxID=652676 RepID=A0A160TKC8_9ZZZZ